MDRSVILAATAILISAVLLCTGCLGEKASASVSVKYVCPDGSIVSESRECRAAEKTCDCAKSNQAPGSDPAEKQPSRLPDAAVLGEESNKSGPCEFLGCPAEARFVGNSETKKYHDCGCAQAQRLSIRKRVCFISAKYAESLGYVPCGFCKPGREG